jgi:propanol-preferring alcohol dehydrogenase
MALKSAHVATGKVVVVSGVAGAIGHLTAAMARQIYGAKAIGIDFGWKNDILRKKHHGEIADILLDVPEDTHGEAWVEFTTALTRSCMRLRHDKGTERAADSLIICASKESAFKQMEDYICDGGRIVCSGYVFCSFSYLVGSACCYHSKMKAKGSTNEANIVMHKYRVPKGLSVSLSIHDLVERKLHLTGTLMGGHDVALEVMDYISSGRIRPVIVERKIENVPEILEQIVDCKGIGKMVVNMHN